MPTFGEEEEEDTDEAPSHCARAPLMADLRT